MENCPAILGETLSEARAALAEVYGPDPERWAWGEVAHIQMPHLGFDGLPLLGGMFSRSTPIPGGPESLFTNAVRLSTAPRLSSTSFSSSYQGIYDLSDLDASEFMISSGQSGHFKSPYYNNLTAGWIAGERIRLPADVGHVARIATLGLVPDQ